MVLIIGQWSEISSLWDFLKHDLFPVFLDLQLGRSAIAFRISPPWSRGSCPPNQKGHEILDLMLEITPGTAGGLSDVELLVLLKWIQSEGSRFRLVGLLRYDQWGGEFFVESEEVFHSLAFGDERLLAVAAVHGQIQHGMGFGQRGRHRDRIVKVRQRAFGELRPRIQDGI
jgi:hypothetical protein